MASPRLPLQIPKNKKDPAVSKGGLICEQRCAAWGYGAFL